MAERPSQVARYFAFYGETWLFIPFLITFLQLRGIAVISGVSQTCVVVLEVSLTPFRAGGGAKRPPSGFSRATPKRLEISSSYSVTFSKHSLCAVWQKMPGQVRSGHQNRLVGPTSEITPEVEFFTEQFHLLRFSLGYQYVQFVYLRIFIFVT